MNLTALVYLFIFFGGLFKALAGRPIWGLYVYFLCVYFHAPTQWWGASLPDLRWALLASLVTLLALFFHPPQQKIRFWVFPENRFLTLLMIFVLAQLGFSLNFQIQMEYVELLLKFILLIFLVQNTVHTLKDIQGVILVNVFGAAFLAYQGIASHTGGRLEGIGTPGMESANQLGQHFALVLLMGSYLLLDRFRSWHLLLAAGIVLILMAVFMTESRGVIASLALAGVFAMWFVPQGSRKKLTLFAAAGLFASASLMGPQIMERFQGVKSDETGEIADASAASRLVILEAEYNMFKTSPVVGHGHRGTLLLSPLYLSAEYMDHSHGGEGRRASHNTFSGYLVDHGVVGAFLYFSALFICMSRLYLVRGTVSHLSEKDQEQYRRLAGLLAGCLLALFTFLMAGMGSNNKKLEGGIWIIALAPVISSRMLVLRHKNKLKAQQERLLDKDVV
jgi:O-antigen ligase